MSNAEKGTEKECSDGDVLLYLYFNAFFLTFADHLKAIACKDMSHLNRYFFSVNQAIHLQGKKDS